MWEYDTVRLYVKDIAGNVSTCETYIVIQDNVAPVITTCPANKTVQCSDNLAPVMSDFVATDNCPNAITVAVTDTYSAGTGNACEVLQHVFWKASDPVGITATCTAGHQHPGYHTSDAGR